MEKMKLEVDLDIKDGAQQLALAYIAGRIRAALEGEMSCGDQTMLAGFGSIRITRTVYVVADQFSQDSIKPIKEVIFYGK